MTPPTPRFAEFFAGAGMVRAALSDGWDLAFANDIDAGKCAAYAENWGADGLICARPGEALLIQGAPPVKVISTHGAGDAFAGALAAVLTQGTALPDALAFAQGMAALTVATPPDARAAITYSSSRMRRNSDRVMRATAVQLTTPIARVIIGNEAPKSATITMEKSSVGRT